MWPGGCHCPLLHFIDTSLAMPWLALPNVRHRGSLRAPPTLGSLEWGTYTLLVSGATVGPRWESILGRFWGLTWAGSGPSEGFAGRGLPCHLLASGGCPKSLEFSVRGTSAPTPPPTMCSVPVSLCPHVSVVRVRPPAGGPHLHVSNYPSSKRATF